MSCANAQKMGVESCLNNPKVCDIYNFGDADLRRAIDNNRHLHEYLHNAPVGTLYVEKLSGDLDKHIGALWSQIHSIIYSVGESVFIHVKSRGSNERRLYSPVEPMLPPEKSKKIMKAVEAAMAASIDERWDYRTLDEKAQLLKKLLRRVIKVSNKGVKFGSFIVSGDKLIMHKDTFKAVEYILLRDKVGIGPIEPIVRDNYVEDISVPGAGPVFVEHKIFESCETTVTFDAESLKAYVEMIGERIGRPVSQRRPIIDGALPDGSRINIVYSEDVSLKGPNLTIRKFTPIPMSIVQLCKANTLDYKMAAYLWLLFDSNMNVWFCGETASGKTTLLKAVTAFIPFYYKIVSIEDTPEVVVPHANWVREVTREGGESSKIDLFELLRAALRQRPNYIIVGEIRGREGNVAFQAMQTGHGTIATFHAGSVEKLIQRLISPPIEIPKTYIDSLNAITIQSAVRHPKTGKLVRRVLGIYEILGYDTFEKRFNYIEVFAWDPVTDTFSFKGVGSSALLEERIAAMRGIPRNQIKKIYEELEDRAEILRLAGEAGITGYYEVFELIKRSKLIGAKEFLKMLKSGEFDLNQIQSSLGVVA